MTDKKKPVPFSADQHYVDFLNEAADASHMSRSAFMRHAIKEYTRERCPQVHLKFFPRESSFMPSTPTEPMPVPVNRVPELPVDIPTQRVKVLPPILEVTEPEDDDFLAQVKVQPKVVTHGVPDACPSCDMPRHELSNGVITRTILQCSTNPERGKWVCTECSASGEYF